VAAALLRSRGYHIVQCFNFDAIKLFFPTLLKELENLQKVVGWVVVDGKMPTLKLEAET
jgi:hypothetical protein